MGTKIKMVITMRNNDEIITVISKLMNKQNLSVSELARRTNMAKSTVSRYLNKTREFPLNKAETFAKVLKITPEYLLGLEKNQQSNAYETITSHTDGELTDEQWNKVIKYARFIKENEDK